jgi:hypothetical protein
LPNDVDSNIGSTPLGDLGFCIDVHAFLHESRGVEQVQSSYLVWHFGGVGLLLDGKQKLTVGGGSMVIWLKSKLPINSPERGKIITTALK